MRLLPLAAIAALWSAPALASPYFFPTNTAAPAVSLAATADPLAVAADAPAADQRPVAIAEADPSPTPTPASGDQPPKFSNRPRYLPPLFIVDETENRHFFMLMMLYWSDWNPDRSYHLLIPFFYERHNAHSQGTTYAGPFFYFYSSPASKAGYIPPVYIERGAEISRTGVPPFFWYGRLGHGDDRRVTSWLFPVYFYQEEEGHRLLATPIGGGWGSRDDFQGLVGPYYWRNTHLHGDRAPNGYDVDLDAHVLFPIFWHLHLNDTSTVVAGPYFSQTQEYRDGTRRRAFGIVPLFYERTAPGGAKTVVTPLSIFERRDPETEFLITLLGGFSKSPSHTTVVVGPWVSTKYKDGDRFQMLFPLYFHGVGTEDQGREKHSWTVLGPLIARRSDYDGPDGTRQTEISRALFPLFWYTRDNDRYSFVSPLVIVKKTPDRFAGLFGPFYRSYGRGRQTWVLLPGLWYHTSPSIERSYGFLPFYYVHKKGHEITDPKTDEKRTVPGATYAGLVPIYFYSNRIDPYDMKRRRSVTLLPLFVFGERPGYLYFVSPVYAQFRTPDDTRVMAAWLWWDHKTPDSRNLTLFPLFHFERDPNHREVITPVGGYIKTKDSLRALWGPYWHVKDDLVGINDTVVFPLFWDFRSPTGRTLVVPPYFQVKEGQYFSEGILPLWFHNSYPGAATTVVIPFFLERHDKIEKTRMIVTPLGGLWRREDPRAYKLLAPFVYQASGPGVHTTVLFPIFWYDYDHGRQTFLVPPFYLYRDLDKKIATTTLIPIFFWHSEPGQTAFATLPGIFFWRVEEQKSTVVLPLLYYWTRNPYRSAGIAGPWFWRKSLRPGEPDYLRGLLPLFIQSRAGDRTAFASPLFLRFADSRGSTNILPGGGWATKRDPATGALTGWSTLVGPIYVRKADHAADVVAFPIFFHTHDEKHAETALVPLFDYRRQGHAWRFFTLGAGGGSDPDLHRSWWWVVNTFHTQDGDTNATAFLPLAYVKSSPHSKLIATPLLFYAADKDEHTSVTLAPLFYRRTSPSRDTWVAFPLAFRDVDKERGIGVGAILPVAIWMRSKERSWTAVPLALTYYERRGEDHLAVYGPVIDVKLEGRRTVGMIPVFRYHTEGEGDERYSTFASLPFIFWVRHGKYTRAFVGAGYWNTETGTRVFPLYLRLQSMDDAGNPIRSTEVGFPLYVRYKTPHKDVMVIAPWYRVKRDDGSKVVGVAPFWYASSRPGQKNWSVLADLVAYEKQGKYYRMTFLWGFHTQPKLSKKPLPEVSGAPRKVAVEDLLLEPGC